MSSIAHRSGAGLALLVATVSLPAGAQERSTGPVVTAASQVTANAAPVRAHTSPQIAVNPKNGELVLVESDVRGTRECNVHISVDRGRSWFSGGDLMLKPYVDCSFYAEYGPYASLAFAGDGTLYVVYVASEVLNRERNETPRHVILARSTDGGRTFAGSFVLKAPEGNRDRGLNKGPTLAVDPKDPKRVYVGWRQGVFAANAKEKLKSNIAVSADGGRTFGDPVDLTDERGGDYPWPAVGSDGVVHAVYWTRTGFPPVPFDQPQPIRPIQYVRSNDRGRTWSKPQPIDPGNKRTQRPPALAGDPDSGNLYMVWYSNAEADNLPASGFKGHLDVFFRRSTDGGKTWGDRRVLNDDEKGGVKANQFLPGISIAGNGRVDVAFYDGRLSPLPPAEGTGEDETGFQDVFFTSSADGGRTWRRNVRITDRSIDRSIGVWGNNIDSNHNVGIASNEDGAFLAWQDSRNANREFQPEDVYTAVLEMDGPVAVPSRAGGVPGWALLAGGVAAGMGLAMVIAWALLRKRLPEGLPA